MDLLTQGLMGAVVAQTAVRKGEHKFAAAIGFLSGLMADADILIRSSSDSLLSIEYHRHFTHSIFFIPFGALLAAAICWLFIRGKLAFSRIYLYSFLGFSLSGVLDACTSYGTHLLWPFSEERIAWNLISIIDPIFTLVLLVGISLSFRQHSYRPARITVLICGLYLLAGSYQLHRAEDRLLLLAEERGHQVERLIVKPTIANIVLWRSVYLYDGRYYVDAIRVGIGEPEVYQGESIEKIDVHTRYADYPSTSVQFKDILRFQGFSDDYLALSPDDSDILGDVRYSILPTSVKPLWGLILDRENPEQHARYEFFRDHDAASRGQFMDMLLGK